MPQLRQAVPLARLPQQAPEERVRPRDARGPRAARAAGHRLAAVGRAGRVSGGSAAARTQDAAQADVLICPDEMLHAREMYISFVRRSKSLGNERNGEHRDDAIVRLPLASIATDSRDRDLFVTLFASASDPRLERITRKRTTSPFLSLSSFFRLFYYYRGQRESSSRRRLLPCFIPLCANDNEAFSRALNFEHRIIASPRTVESSRAHRTEITCISLLCCVRQLEPKFGFHT